MNVGLNNWLEEFGYKKAMIRLVARVKNKFASQSEKFYIADRKKRHHLYNRSSGGEWSKKSKSGFTNIYEIYFINDNGRYVGLTIKPIEERLQEHLHQAKWQNEYTKKGWKPYKYK